MVKQLVFGAPGERPRRIRAGLLKGLQFHLDTASKSMRLMGMDEREIAGWTARFARDAATAVDVGANDGWYSLYFASRSNITAVYSFEPDGGLNEQFKRNVQLNGEALLKKVTLERKFVGNKTDPGWRRLDDVLHAALGPIVLKIDVDGGEVEVLEGAKATLAKADCRLVIETHSPELEQGCIQFLTALGYTTTIVHNGWYRVILPETRNIPHNRWLIAAKAR